MSREGVEINTFGVIENTPRVFKISFGVTNQTDIDKSLLLNSLLQI